MLCVCLCVCVCVCSAYTQYFCNVQTIQYGRYMLIAVFALHSKVMGEYVIYCLCGLPE